MTHLKPIIVFVIIIICFSCKNTSSNSVDNEGGRPKYGGRPINVEDTTAIPAPDEVEVNSDESVPDFGVEFVDWADGNTYSYYYTEQIEWKDSTGIRNVTVYIQDKPTDVYCDTVRCEWCGKEMTSQGYTFEEYPNLDVLRGKENGLSNGFFSSIQLALSIATEKQYWDLKNNRIRTEWSVNCDYGGPDGFCSLKCKREYNNNNR